MSAYENIVSRLDRVRHRQPGQVSARCPAHEDKGPSLSVRETPEGAVLVHCFAGCDVAEIIAALGLELHDLFPPRDRPANAPKRTAKLLTAGQALDLLHDEAQLVGVCAANIAHGVSLTDRDRARLMAAAARISRLVEMSQ